MAALASSATDDVQESNRADLRVVEKMLEKLFFHSDIARSFIVGELQPMGLAQPLKGGEGRGLEAMVSLLQLDRRMFLALEAARPGLRTDIWGTAQRVGVLPPAVERRGDASRDPVARRDQLGGQRYVVRTIEGEDGRTVVFAHLEGAKGSGRRLPVLLAGPPRSGKTRFLLELASFYSFDVARSAIIEGAGARSADGHVDERVDLERQIVAVIQDWYPGNGLAPEYSVLSNWLKEQMEGGGDTAFLLIDDLASVEVLDALVQTLPPSLYVVAVVRGSDRAAPREALKLDPLSVDDLIGILVEGSRPSDARSNASRQIVERLAGDLNAIVIASRLLLYCRPPQLLEWLEAESADEEREAERGVRLCLRVLHHRLGVADSSSEEALTWRLLCCLALFAPDRPVGVEVLRRCLRGADDRRDPLVRHVQHAIDSLARLRLVGRLDGQPCVTAAVQEAVRAFAPDAIVARRAPVARALAEIVPRRYPELETYVSPDRPGEDDSLLEHALGVVLHILADPSSGELRGPDRAGSWRLCSSVLRRLTRLGRIQEIEPLADWLWDVVVAAVPADPKFSDELGADEALELLGLFQGVLEAIGQNTAFGSGFTGPDASQRARTAMRVAQTLEARVGRPAREDLSAAEARPSRLLSLVWLRLAWLTPGADEAAVQERRRRSTYAWEWAEKVKQFDPCLRADVLVAREDDILKVLAIELTRQFTPGSKEREIEAARPNIRVAFDIYEECRRAGVPADRRAGFALTRAAQTEIDLVQWTVDVDEASGEDAVVKALEAADQIRARSKVACEAYGRVRTPLHPTVLALRRRMLVQVTDLLLRALAKASGAWRVKTDDLVSCVADCVARLRFVLDGQLLWCGAAWPNDGRKMLRMQETVNSVMVYARLSCLFAALVDVDRSAGALVEDVKGLLEASKIARAAIFDAELEAGSTPETANWGPTVGDRVDWDLQVVAAILDACSEAGRRPLSRALAGIGQGPTQARENLRAFLCTALENS